MNTDEVISEIGIAIENLLEKDVHGFTWDLENKVKKRVLIESDLYHLFSDKEIEEKMLWYDLFTWPKPTEKQKIDMLSTLIDKLTQWTEIELSDDVLEWRKQNNEINLLIEEIKNYSEIHPELKKSHHFCFNIPIPVDNIRPKLSQDDGIVLIMGQNPGEKIETWNYLPKNLESNHKDIFRKMKTTIEIRDKVAEIIDNKEQISGYPVEASSYFDFWDDEDPNNWKDNKKLPADSSHNAWHRKIKNICEDNCKKNDLAILQTEYFFWSTNNLGKFKDRFGFDWENNPHKEFCININKKLIEYYDTKVIIYFGIGDADRLKESFQLEEAETYPVPVVKENKKNLAKLYFLKRKNKKDIPFLICTHISNRPSNKELECIKLLFEYMSDNNGEALPQQEYKERLERINS